MKIATIEINSPFSDFHKQKCNAEIVDCKLLGENVAVTKYNISGALNGEVFFKNEFRVLENN